MKKRCMLLYFVALMFFVVLSAALADAAEVRVGFHMGAGQPRKAKVIGYKALYLGLIVAVFSTSFLFVLSPQISMWLTPDPTLQRMIFDVLPLVCAISCY